MILFINIKLTSQRITQYINRGFLRPASSLDIFKYMMLSLKDLYPWKKMVLNIVVDPNSYPDPAKKELFGWLETTLADQTLVLNDTRCEYQSQWKKWYEDHVEREDELIFLLANHDHIFYGNSPDYFKTLIQRYREVYGNIDSSLYLSHYPEMLGFSLNTPLHDDLYFVREIGLPDSVQVLTTTTYKKWWMEGNFEELHLPRSDWPPSHGCPNAFNSRPVVIPKVELLRHFDGYNHTNFQFHMNHFLFGHPLEIPKGIIEKEMILSIGYNPDPNLTCIDATRPYLANAPDGAHHRGLSKDIPFFWKKYCSSIIKQDGYDETSVEVLQANANNLLQTLEVYINGMVKDKKSEFLPKNAENILKHYLQ